MDKTFSSEVKQIGQEEYRVLRFITSTESEDRDGDIIETDGWKLDNYMKNPVILYGHDYGGLPVGKSVNIQKDSINKKLIQDVKFPTKDEYEFADTVYRLAKSGYLNATSVGFIGLQSEPRINEKGEYLGKRYKKQELLETSIVPVPSNPTALTEARSKGIINYNELKMLEEAKTVITKPGWDETETSFRFRVRSPGLFTDGSFRTVQIKKDKPRVNSVMGRLKDETTLTVQSIIFPKEDDWDLSSAKSWLKEHEDLTKGCDNVKTNKDMISKEADLEGNPSAYDIEEEIQQTINPNYIMHGVYVMDLYPKEYPSGNVIICRQNKYYQHVYKYEKTENTIKITLDDGKEVERIFSAKKIKNQKNKFTEKAGATISAKTKESLEACVSDLQKGIEKLNNIIGANSEDEKSKTSVKIEMSDEIKKAFEDMQSQIVLLSKKNNEDEINLDSIEFINDEKNAAQDELDIKPDELKALIKEVIQNEINLKEDIK